MIWLCYVNSSKLTVTNTWTYALALSIRWHRLYSMTLKICGRKGEQLVVGQLIDTHPYVHFSYFSIDGSLSGAAYTINSGRATERDINYFKLTIMKYNEFLINRYEISDFASRQYRLIHFTCIWVAVLQLFMFVAPFQWLWNKEKFN